MWGREMRAGLVFVLVSVAAGGAFRGWQRAHPERFDSMVASLVDEDAGDAARGMGRAAPPSGAATDSASGGDGAAGVSSLNGRAHHAAQAQAPRPASIDVDRAPAAELLRLPGIGPALAARIVAEREAGGPFGGPDGLLRVRGIGPKTLEKIRPYLSR